MRDFALTLISKYQLYDIEASLTKAYITTNGLDEFVLDSLLTEILNKEIDSELTKEVLAFKKRWELDDLVLMFEMLIDNDVKKATGAVYTPEYIIKHIFHATIKKWNASQTIIDPSCGCGAFLLYAAKAIKNSIGERIDRIIEQNIFGADINPESIVRAKILLSLLAVNEHEDRADIKFNLVCCNSIRDNVAFLLRGRSNAAFDYVIGNPPYVNTHEIDNETRAFLRKEYTTTTTGVFNLFYAFVELGYHLLCNTGRLGYIVPNNFIVIEAAEPLRHYLQSTECIESILDFGSNVAFNPIKTYNAILILNKESNSTFRYCKLKYTKDISAALCAADYSKIELSSLDIKSWHLLSRTDSENIKKIETAGYQIGQAIHTGIATLADKLYMVEMLEVSPGYYGKEHDGKTYLIESELVKKLIKVSKNVDETALANATLGILFPYEYSKDPLQLSFENARPLRKASIISEEAMKQRFPQAYTYLCAIQNHLRQRDKGKPNNTLWYAYGRSQGLNAYGRKIFFPTFSKVPRFIIDACKTTLFCNGYALFVDETPYLNHVEALKRILNSCIMQFYVKKTSYSIEGDFKCYQKKYVKSFGIPKLTEDEMVWLEQCENSKEIDKFLIRKYGLTIN